MQFKHLKDRLNRELEVIQELEEKLSQPDIVADQAKFKDLSREHARLSPRKDQIAKFLDLMKSHEEYSEILQDASSDSELKEMAREEIPAVTEEIEQGLEMIRELLVPPDPNEGRGLIMEIRAGTGGEEAALFVSDLYRMYLQFAETQGFRVEELSQTATEIGGIKEVVFSVDGQDAYKRLHLEGGTHRVQRIPVTESGGRIHTSAVTVAVMPEVEEEELDIQEKDLRIDVYRASGAGGQHVNKTESAVRITHIPTGVVVSCQDERSQIKNRAKAMKVLRARLVDMQEAERHSSESAKKKEQIGSGDRSERIRTYNFPQGRMTDHRINFTSYNLGAFMTGEMNELLDALHRSEIDSKLGDSIK